MKLFGRKKEEKVQEQQPSTKNAAPKDKAQDQFAQNLLNEKNPNLGDILKSHAEDIAKSKELASLGHAISFLADEYRKNLAPVALRAYEQGYFHLLPLWLGEVTQGLDKLGIIQIDVDGSGKYQNYGMPGHFLVEELMNPDKAQLYYQHSPGTSMKEEIIQQFGQPSIEPAIRNVFPNFIVQAAYKNLLYIIFEFSDAAKATEFIIATRVFWTDFIINKLHLTSSKEFLKVDNGLEILDLPMSFYPPAFRSPAMLTEDNRVWWRQGNIVLSICNVGKEGENERIGRKKTIGALLGMLHANEKYLSQAMEKVSDHSLQQMIDGTSETGQPLEQYFAEGEDLFEKKKYQEALSKFAIVLQKDPQNGIAHRYVGTIKMFSNDNVTAETELQKAIEINPLDELAYNSLGQLYNITKQYDKAEKALRKAIEINPEMINHYNLARLLSNMGRCTEALDELEKIIRTNPKFIQVYGDVLDTLMRSIKIEENARREIFKRSEALYKNALLNFPNVGPIHSGFGYVLMFTGRKDEAEKEFLKALELFPRDQIAQMFLMLKKKEPKTWNNLANFYR